MEDYVSPPPEGPMLFMPEEAAEFAGWERLGDEAWVMIDQWEREEGSFVEARESDVDGTVVILFDDPTKEVK